jgi:IS605 OrfB family transposase
MKQTLFVKLMPTPKQHAALMRTLEAFNAACNTIASVVCRERCTNKLELQKLVYYDIRAHYGLSSQMAIRAISKVSDSFKAQKHRDKQPAPYFRPHGAMVYDERICSFPRIDCASLLTLEGRADIPFCFGAYAADILKCMRGQTDLLYRNGKFFLAITVDVQAPKPIEPDDFLGVDLGIVHLATTSDGEYLDCATGPKNSRCVHINSVRGRYSRFRQKLQKKGTKSAKRLLKKRSGRERRFARDVNHCLSKAMINTAKGTSRGIALEDLTHIRERAKRTVTKRQRRVLHSWAFFQLRTFSAYKAHLSGVRVVYVNPAYTSQTCSACGHCEKADRSSQSKFLCRACGFSAHADVNAAVNIRQSARSRAAVIPPDAAALVG